MTDRENKSQFALLKAAQLTSEQCREDIISNDYADFIVSTSRPAWLRDDPFGEICSQPLGRNFFSVHIPRDRIPELSIERFGYGAFPLCYTLIDTTALEASGIQTIQQYPGLELKGSGVLVGFIDTGIDYTNKIFRKADGTTRIKAIWDQTEQSGAMPPGINFGSEYSEEDINRALKAEDPYEVVPSRDVNSHGTYVASVAAGSEDADQQFCGAAPDCDIAVVKLKPAKQYLKEFYFIKEDSECYQENDIMLAVVYLYQLAFRLGQPLMVCIALGTNMGDHTGSSPLSSLLNNAADTNTTGIVVGTGNETNLAHHYYGTLDSTDMSEEVEIQVGEDCLGFTLEFWGQSPDIFSMTIISPTGQRTGRENLSGGTSSETYNFVFERTRVHVDYRIMGGRSGSELILMRFERPAAGIWKLQVGGILVIDGSYNMWLPVEEFLTTQVRFLRPNPDTTLTEPSSAKNVITAAAYNVSNNSIYINSGRGFARTGDIKPDLAAPGVGVYGGLPGNRFAARTGSSAATAVMAGAATLLLEWEVLRNRNDLVTTIDLKNSLIRGARVNAGITYPNKSWGYGSLDLYNTFERLRRI